MRAGGNTESSAQLRARATLATPLELDRIRRMVDGRVKTFEHNVVWPSLAESWRADLAHVDGLIAARGAA